MLWSAKTAFPTSQSRPSRSAKQQGVVVGRYYQPEALEAAFPLFSEFRSISEGPRGGVFAVYDHGRSERVALKLVRDVGDESNRRSFAEEYRLLTSIVSERLIQVFQASFEVSRSGTAGLPMREGTVPHLWFTMELGDSDVRKRLPNMHLEARVQVIHQLLEALRFLHAKRVAHRDIKPDNLFLFEGQVKLGDFGIAQAQRTQLALGVREGPVGTPQYLALERWHAQPPGFDWRPSDQYAAGVTMFEILSKGQQPLTFGAALDRSDWAAVEAIHRDGPIASLVIPEQKQRPEATEAVIRRMLSNHPAQRYPDIRDCYLAFRTAVAHDRIGGNEDPR